MTDKPIVLRISVPDLDVRKSISVQQPQTETVGQIKRRLIDSKLPNLPGDALNFGLFFDSINPLAQATTATGTIGSQSNLSRQYHSVHSLASTAHPADNDSTLNLAYSNNKRNPNSASSLTTSLDNLVGTSLVSLASSQSPANDKLSMPLEEHVIFIDYLRTSLITPSAEGGFIDLEFKRKHRLRYPPHLTANQVQRANGKKAQRKFIDALWVGDKEEIKRQLQLNGIDPNFQFSFDESISNSIQLTPLIFSVLTQDRELMQLLIESGAIMDYRLDSSGPFARNTVNSAPNVSGDGTNVFNSSWFTPLHVAAFENKIDSLKFLMSYGAAINVEDSAGLTPFYHACRLGHSEIVKWLLFASLAIGSSSSTVDSSVAEHKQPIKPILNLEASDNQNQTALHHASVGGFYQICYQLLDHGANPNAINSMGNSSLHLACTTPSSGPQFKQCAAILLSYGADRELKNRVNQTAVQLALLAGNTQLSQFIKTWSPTTAEGTAITKQPTPLAQLNEKACKLWRAVVKLRADAIASSAAAATAAATPSKSASGAIVTSSITTSPSESSLSNNQSVSVETASAKTPGLASNLASPASPTGMPLNSPLGSSGAGQLKAPSVNSLIGNLPPHASHQTSISSGNSRQSAVVSPTSVSPISPSGMNAQLFGQNLHQQLLLEGMGTLRNLKSKSSSGRSLDNLAKLSAGLPAPPIPVLSKKSVGSLDRLSPMVKATSPGLPKNTSEKPAHNLSFTSTPNAATNPMVMPSVGPPPSLKSNTAATPVGSNSASPVPRRVPPPPPVTRQSPTTTGENSDPEYVLATQRTAEARQPQSQQTKSIQRQLQPTKTTDSEVASNE